MTWRFRWYLCSYLTRLAFWIAPRGPARDLYVAALTETSRRMLAAIAAEKEGKP